MPVTIFCVFKAVWTPPPIAKIIAFLKSFLISLLFCKSSLSTALKYKLKTIINKDLVQKSLKDTQTETGYYTYNNISLAQYDIDGKKQLVYVAPREAENNSISYNNKTYEYTHGMGQIVASATSVTEDGNVEYLQKDILL